MADRGSLSIPVEQEIPDAELFVSSERFETTQEALFVCQDYANNGGLHIIDGPLVNEAMLAFCDKNADMAATKAAGNYLGSLVVAGALERFTLETRAASVTTPNERELSLQVLNRGLIDFILVPRAALAFTNGIDAHIPSANQYFYGLTRDEETLEPIVYMDKVPSGLKGRTVIVADTMLASGGSAEHTVSMAYKRGAAAVKVIAMIPAPQGVSRLIDTFASDDFEIACPPLHWGLNNAGFIVPGLGDAGDRRFGALADPHPVTNR